MGRVKGHLIEPVTFDQSAADPKNYPKTEYAPAIGESLHGDKFDDDKPRMDLLPEDALLEVGKVFLFGCKKYSENNWRKGIKFSKLTGSSDRHGLKWRSPLWSDLDEESGLNHIAHRITNDLMLLQLILEGRKDLDDRYKK